MIEWNIKLGGSGEKSPAGEMGYRGKPPVELNGKSIIMK